jgi:O-methyltransferase
VNDADYSQLWTDVEAALLSNCRSAAILGLTPVTVRLVSGLMSTGLSPLVHAIYVERESTTALQELGTIPIHPMRRISRAAHDLLIVASDERKEDLLRQVLPFVTDLPRVLLAGYGHTDFRAPLFLDEKDNGLVPSLANGYPYSQVHIYQCLENAARLGLQGVVAEFGMFKGGTTAFMARVIAKLGATWRIIGFDTFAGAPPRRTILDMYSHPDCIFTDAAAVRRTLAPYNVQFVEGDIVETSERLRSEGLVFSFVDTDNYSPASAAIRVLRERTVLGGAILFDHVPSHGRFRYTLGERMAAQVLHEDPRYFHLHGTGVFYRQR